MKYSRIVAQFLSTPWAILPEKLAVMTEFIEVAASGQKLTVDEIQTQIGAAKHKKMKASTGGIGVLPVFGVLSQRMDLLDEMSGGTSVERLSTNFNTLMKDDTISTIVLQIDSPGGSVFGITEFADLIREASETKRIIAVADSLAASAAYWIGSAAPEFVVTPGGEVGSIGVLTGHVDISVFEEAMGVKTTLIHAGKHKIEGNPFEPLSSEARENIQKDVNAYYEMFVKDVAAHRGTTANRVRNGFGEGRTVMAQEALTLGMVDRIASFDQVMSDLTGKSGNRRAMAERNQQMAQLS